MYYRDIVYRADGLSPNCVSRQWTHQLSLIMYRNITWCIVLIDYHDIIYRANRLIDYRHIIYRAIKRECIW